MKIFAIGDPHFKPGNLYFMKWACQEILEIAGREKPDLCICLGDTLDTNNRIDMRAQIEAVNFFFKLSDICPLIVLIGNHDRENKTDFLSDIHPFVALNRTPNITIVSKTLWDRERNFIYVPYVAPGRFREALETVDYYPEDTDLEDQPRLIFAHQEIRGSFYGPRKNSVFEEGDVWSNKLPLIISGHIHEYQVLPGVIYVGTFYQQNYGESSNKAVMMIYLGNSTNDPIPEINVQKTGETSNSAWSVVESGMAQPLIELPKLPNSQALPASIPEQPIDRILSQPIDPKLLSKTVQSNHRVLWIRIQRIPLKSVYVRKTIHLDLSTLPNFARMLPPDNIRFKDLTQSESKKVGTLVQAKVMVDATEKKLLKINPHFLTLEKTVDQVDTITTGDKANLALVIRDQVIQEAKNAKDAKEKESKEKDAKEKEETSVINPSQNPTEKIKSATQDITLVDVVKKLLADDPAVYQMFTQEIAIN